MANQVTGSGQIQANGSVGRNARNDAAGGGGGGGAIVVKSTAISGVSLQANGGNGGNQIISGDESEGPGGGGSGGYIATSVGYGNVSALGGNNGTSNSSAVTEFIPNGATRGAAGISNGSVGAIPMCGRSRLALVKRITAIDNTPINDLVDDPADLTDNDPAFPSSYLRGAINRVGLRPNNVVEYTIYFLSNGLTDNVQSAFLCDRIPTNQTFVPNAYNSISQATGGLSGSDRGVVIAYNGFSSGAQSYTNANDGDRVRFLPLGDTSQPFPGSPSFAALCGSATNPTGAVIVNLGNIPRATTPASSSNAYGLIRFQARVN
jgi:hypothetical protein